MIIDDAVPIGDNRYVPLLDVYNRWNIIRRIEYGEIRKKVARLLALKMLYRYKAQEFFPLWGKQG